MGPLAVALLSACGGPEPRSFNDFMNDPLSRAGALSRCNQDRDANLRDVECANARRAAAAVAVQEERERREELDQASERKLAELRRLVALQQQREREAAEAAAAAAQAAYELQWEGDPPLDGSAADAAPNVPSPPRPAPPFFAAPASAATVADGSSLEAAPTPAPAPAASAAGGTAPAPAPAAAIPRVFRETPEDASAAPSP